MQQKPLSLLQFQRKFGTEEACRKHLFRLRWPEGFRCPRCNIIRPISSAAATSTIAGPAAIRPL